MVRDYLRAYARFQGAPHFGGMEGLQFMWVPTSLIFLFFPPES